MKEAAIKQISSIKGEIVVSIVKSITTDICLQNILIESFKKQIEEIDLFFYNSKTIQNKYEKQLLDFHEQLKNLITRATKHDYNLMDYHSIKKVSYIYRVNSSLFKRFNISTNCLKQVYMEYSDQGIEKLINLLKIIDEEQKYYIFKVKMAKVIEQIQFCFTEANIAVLFKQYKIKDYSDLLDFNKEIGAYIIDSCKLDANLKAQVNRLKNNLKTRLNLKSINDISKAQALDIQKRISNILNDNILSQIMEREDVKRFFDVYGYKRSKSNISELTKILFHVQVAAGSCVYAKMDGLEKTICFYNDVILELNSSDIKEIILHEIIHALSNAKYYSQFNNYLDEGLTQFLAIKAAQFLDHNIVYDKKECIKVTNVYSRLLPLVEILYNSSFWPLFMEAKFKGNTNKLKKEVDYIKICTIFNIAYNTRDSKQLKILTSLLQDCISKSEDKKNSNILKRKIS